MSAEKHCNELSSLHHEVSLELTLELSVDWLCNKCLSYCNCMSTSLHVGADVYRNSQYS